jgi:hypothetical protein
MTRQKTNHFGRLKMERSHPRFSHLSSPSRDEVFEQLHKALNDLAAYRPTTSQDPYWKTFAFKRLEFQDLAFFNGWMDHAFEFPLIEDCFESLLKELPPIPKIALLDPRLQIEVIPLDGGDFPTWACRVRDHESIRRKLEVRSCTGILLLLSQPAIERLPRKEVMEDLRHELGHVLLYLSSPEAIDDCSAADEEWECATRMEDFIG